MDSRPLKVGEINQYIKKVFMGDWLLSNVKVEGEISNFKHHYSGHMYFSLKDENGKLKCVMFKSDNKELQLNLEDGIKVIATGYISVYEREGSYQLYVRNIEESGLGLLFIAFEKLKNKLEDEGLFDQKYKKDIPIMPNRIGVVTSSTGAAVRDIINVIKRRYPIANILIYPVLVQGIQAPREICEGLEYFDHRGDIDIIVTGRGGGSIEELFAFNDESVARTIFSIRTPIISAVGHETDFTIADFVADVRAPTPSTAAEIITPELGELKEYLKQIFIRLCNILNYLIEEDTNKLNYLKKNLDFHNPIYQLKEKVQEQDELFRKLNYTIQAKLDSNRNEIINLFNSLNYLNPISSLNRGYGIIMDENNNVITSVEGASIEEELRIMMKDGIINARAVKISKGEFYDER